MNNKTFRKSIVNAQIFVTFMVLFAIVVSSFMLLRSHGKIIHIPELYIPILIEEITCLVVALQLRQISTRTTDSETQILFVLLLCLNLDGIIILPELQRLMGVTLLPTTVIGKVHLFSLIYSFFLFILIGFFQDEVNTKKSNQYMFFAFTFCLIIVKILPLPSITSSNIWIPFIPLQSFHILLLALLVIAILSFNPFLLFSHTKHGRTKIVSYFLLMFSVSLMRFELVNKFFGNTLAAILLVAGSILLIKNFRSYRI